jgi:hypothetical protein
MILDGVAVRRCSKGIGFEYDLRAWARIRAERSNFHLMKPE